MSDGLGVGLVCPKCRGPLKEEGQAVRCPDCDRSFPVVAGIPDLRIAPDPWIGLAEDRAKALRVLEVSEGKGFADTVRAYWSLTPTTPAPLAERFVDHVVRRAKPRSAEWLRAAGRDADPDSGSWLDLGCGTADLAAAAGTATSVVGVDIALRWLVIARKRLEEEGVPARLVCANAEALPFATGTFGRVFGLGVVEHCEDHVGVLNECRRVLRSGGVVRLRAVNRYSLLPEPHVDLMGVGYLPRPVARAYVRWRTGQPYEHHNLPGRGALARDLRRAGLMDARVEAAPTLSTEAENMSGMARRLVPLYEWSRGLPMVGRLVDRVAPLLEARGVAP